MERGRDLGSRSFEAPGRPSRPVGPFKGRGVQLATALIGKIHIFDSLIYIYIFFFFSGAIRGQNCYKWL